MRKHLFLLVFGLIPLVVGAQVTINAQLPPAGLVQKDQLWNLNIVNNKEDALEVNIKMILRDALSGQAILSANTGNLIISKGIKIITSRDLQPIQYNYDLQGFSRTYLPMGSYDACYRLYNVNQKGEEPLGDDCIKFTIDPLSPPLLNSPSNESEIESHYPHFTWMPPAPYDMFSDLNYEILLTEVLPGQSASEAIQYNTALYDRSNINATYENYPASFEKLDTGKVYAWQVIAKNGMNYSAKTEVWKFKLRKEDQPKLATYDNVYIL